jgi:hypothetical protein
VTVAGPAQHHPGLAHRHQHRLVMPLVDAAQCNGSGPHPHPDSGRMTAAVPATVPVLQLDVDGRCRRSRWVRPPRRAGRTTPR